MRTHTSHKCMATALSAPRSHQDIYSHFSLYFLTPSLFHAVARLKLSVCFHSDVLSCVLSFPSIKERKCYLMAYPDSPTPNIVVPSSIKG